MKGLLAYTLYQFKSNKKYRMNNVMTIMSTFIAIVIQYYIWTYVEKTNGMDTQQIIIYSMFALTLSSLLPLFSSADFMNHIILKGTIANYLQRPQMLFLVNSSIQIGNSFYKIIYRIIPIWVIYIIFFKINIMTVDSVLLLALLSLCFSWILSLIIGHIIGLLSPYLISINGTKSLISGLILLLGGGVLPIDIYPEPLKLIVLKLPFVALQYFPSAILSGSQLFSYKTALLIQLCWILFFLLVLFILQKRVYSKLEIMGG